jgi:hypothetical protein
MRELQLAWIRHWPGRVNLQLLFTIKVHKVSPPASHHLEEPITWNAETTSRTPGDEEIWYFPDISIWACASPA